MSSYGGFGMPGHGAAAFTTEREILWGGDDQHMPKLFKNSIISGATRDAGNTPTTVLRRGLLLGRVDATGQLEEWDADASDGTQNIAAILDVELRANDFDGNNSDRAFRTILKAPLIAKNLLIQGDPLVGHVDEYLARRQLHDMGCILDDDPCGYLAGKGNRLATVTGTTHTITPEANGTTFFYSSANGVTATLPEIQPGLEYTVVRVADEEFVVASAEGDNIVVGNDLSADSVTVTTAGEQIGASYTVRSVYIGGVLKWLFYINLVPFSTDDYLTKSITT
jgi:hypothetical protein